MKRTVHCIVYSVYSQFRRVFNLKTWIFHTFLINQRFKGFFLWAEMKDPLMKDYLESRNNTCLYNFNDPPFKRFSAVPN